MNIEHPNRIDSINNYFFLFPKLKILHNEKKFKDLMEINRNTTMHFRTM